MRKLLVKNHRECGRILLRRSDFSGDQNDFSGNRFVGGINPDGR